MKNSGYAASSIVCGFLAVIVLLLSSGCSSLKVVETWHKPAVQEHRYQKIMILGIARDEGKRGTFENLVADELSKHQVVAVPANTVIPVLNMDKMSREAIISVVKASGCDAVLTTRAMAVGSSAVSQGGETAYIYGANILSSHYDFMKATLQTSLYDVATEQLVWSSTVTTADSDSTARVSRDLGRFFYDSLRRDGLL
jgi:hypothetical protein